MQTFPTHPHDWALWLFEKLEQLEHAGDYWQGVLPGEYDFQAVAEALPDQLRGQCDADRRTIEFYPGSVGVFDSMADLVLGQRRRRAPELFTVRELAYTHGRTEPIPEIVKQYLGAVRLWQLFDSSADHGSGQAFSLYFIKSFEAKTELRCEYTATDLRPLAGLEEFAQNYFESDHHRDQKRTIIRNALLEIFKGKPVVRLSDVLQEFADLAERVRSAYTLYTTDFSFEKLRSEVDKQNLEDMLRLNKTFSDIQNQLLAIPAAMLLVGASIKANSLTANFATLVGVTIFVWIMYKLIRNQFESVNAINDEVLFRQLKVQQQPDEISQKLLERFTKLATRVAEQKSVLSRIRLAVTLVWFITVLIVVYTEWPDASTNLLVQVWDGVKAIWIWGQQHLLRSELPSTS